MSAPLIPYLPILGPVHPAEATHELLDALYVASQQGVFLSSDKAQRWYDAPQDRIVDLTWSPQGLLVKTEKPQGSALYAYGDASIPEGASGTIIRLSSAEPACAPGESCTTIFIDEYVQQPSGSRDEHIVYAHDLEKALLTEVGEMGGESSRAGFRALLAMDKLKDDQNPTLVYVRDGVVLGALGPLSIMKDSRGIPRLLPSYFGVSEAVRRQGVGAVLWAASRQWASKHAAEYTVLQAETGSPAERFYESQGLCRLGYVHKSTL